MISTRIWSDVGADDSNKSPKDDYQINLLLTTTATATTHQTRFNVTVTIIATYTCATISNAITTF